ncbi:hypothetical protein L208DRAFT_1418431 [Tricholoma matsutake]|nr:hypothetical protein L208DRAFT_1418431 [Tricholoma matsutake 945]
MDPTLLPNDLSDAQRPPNDSPPGSFPPCWSHLSSSAPCLVSRTAYWHYHVTANNNNKKKNKKKGNHRNNLNNLLPLCLVLPIFCHHLPSSLAHPYIASDPKNTPRFP